jgi:hypothetical protein
MGVIKIMTTMYIIRNNSTNKYLHGTPGSIRWGSKPRLFQTLGLLRSFLTGVITINKLMRESHYDLQGTDMSNWVVDSMELTLSETKELHEVISFDMVVELLKT